MNIYILHYNPIALYYIAPIVPALCHNDINGLCVYFLFSTFLLLGAA
jgi:hypothetical protein